MLSIIVYRYGFAHRGMDTPGIYSPLIVGQFHELNLCMEADFLLPDKYPFYGRFEYIEDGAPLLIVNDRLVTRFYFEHHNTVYYLMASYTIYDYLLTYPDIILASTNDVVAILRENPEGYFINGDYLYYAYGPVRLNTRTFGAFITGHDIFIRRNFVNYNFARLNLNTMNNEDVRKEDYELLYNIVSHTNIYK
jgi:hypothetical protein